MIKNALTQAKALEEAAKTLRKAHAYNQQLLNSGYYAPCDHCGQAIRVEQHDDEFWEGFEEQAEELRVLIGNGHQEWTCTAECMQARIDYHKARKS